MGVLTVFLSQIAKKVSSLHFNNVSVGVRVVLLDLPSSPALNYSLRLQSCVCSL